MSEQSLDTIIFGVPIATACVTAFLFWFGLKDDTRIDWLFVIPGVVLLALTCVVLMHLASMRDWNGILGCVASLVTAVAMFVAGMVLTGALHGKRWIVGILLAVGFPVVLILSVIWAVDNLARETIEKQNGRLLAQALDQYHADHKRYPETLVELLPDYVDDLREPTSVWGWLYVTSDDGYALGYVTWVDRYGYSVEVFSSDTAEWEYLSYSSGPFDIPPTHLAPRPPTLTPQNNFK